MGYYIFGQSDACIVVSLTQSFPVWARRMHDPLFVVDDQERARGRLLRMLGLRAVGARPSSSDGDCFFLCGRGRSRPRFKGKKGWWGTAKIQLNIFTIHLYIPNKSIPHYILRIYLSQVLCVVCPKKNWVQF